MLIVHASTCATTWPDWTPYCRLSCRKFQRVLVPGSVIPWTSIRLPKGQTSTLISCGLSSSAPRSRYYSNVNHQFCWFNPVFTPFPSHYNCCALFCAQFSPLNINKKVLCCKALPLIKVHSQDSRRFFSPSTLLSRRRSVILRCYNNHMVTVSVLYTHVSLPMTLL